MTESTSNRGLPKFALLPAELRIFIWQYALPSPVHQALYVLNTRCWEAHRSDHVEHELEIMFFHDELYRMFIDIPLLLVNHEGRNVARSWIRKNGLTINYRFAATGAFCLTRAFKPATDTLHVPYEQFDRFLDGPGREAGRADIDSKLSLYNPANGWTANGANYTTDFVREFLAGVAARCNRILAPATERNKLIAAGKGDYSDDEGLVIPDANYLGFNNKLITQDVRYIAQTMSKWPLLHKDGSNTTQVVPSVTVASAGILITADNITGVDWTSSQTAPIGNVPGISKTLLTMGNAGHYEYLNAEKIYLVATTTDKSIAFVEGTQHTIDTCITCESYSGRYGDTFKTAFTFMDHWFSHPGRFISA
ncbi:2EXR domain-containing protein [Aspergillus homomorphus CBS 101889]|uniref:2EXR domain-containing protein n=1 Tax=Aspergillus homomorphus (strain CBS 101889) TaxID=1450537 RepID=A0A395I8Q7_ASPHC|nr:hypothetical protein BO97DRAFT_421394 [Aspergillus homomorphus CBS 101889]RAL16169.1 hypothetical protein BO97DRAFT_421394 [Aspergillus homomorphus CBS 101889]